MHQGLGTCRAGDKGKQGMLIGILEQKLNLKPMSELPCITNFQRMVYNVIIIL